tara:strand:- start:144 stop:500 length:357 start_codon:yes stop_codon:yes gene_type:complete
MRNPHQSKWESEIICEDLESSELTVGIGAYFSKHIHDHFSSHEWQQTFQQSEKIEGVAFEFENNGNMIENMVSFSANILFLYLHFSENYFSFRFHLGHLIHEGLYCDILLLHASNLRK